MNAISRNKQQEDMKYKIRRICNKGKPYRYPAQHFWKTEETPCSKSDLQDL